MTENIHEVPQITDPLLGWRPRPDNDGFYSTDSAGHRQTDRQTDYRILLLGDSFSFGFASKAEDCYVSVLNKMLGPSVQIINAGCCAYGTAHELLYFVNEGYKYKPDMVILQFFASDITDNIGLYTPGRPRYVIKEGIHIPVKVEVSTTSRYLSDVDKERDPFRDWILKELTLITNWLHYHSSLYNAYRTLFFKVGLLRDSAKDDFKKINLNITLELIEQLKTEIKSHGVDRFVIAIVPAGGGRFNSRVEDRYRLQIVDFLNRMDIPYIYPFEEFRNVESPDIPYIPGDEHFTKEGNQRFAEHLYKLIISLEPSLARKGP